MCIHLHDEFLLEKVIDINNLMVIIHVLHIHKIYIYCLPEFYFIESSFPKNNTFIFF